ncbi:MAG: hypothetical protein J6V90_08990 [Treponema sp.]|nr:hypothetical protein [Treponema sp.]
MIKIKPIIFSACAAFVLSFVTALAAKSGFPISLLKAVIFALLFGAIAVGVQFVYARFLTEGAAPVEPREESKVMGSKVDLVVSEEDLPEDKDAPAFYVEGKHVISGDDVAASKASAADESVSVARQNEALEAAEKVREQKAAENITQKAAEIKAESPAPVAAPASPAMASASQPVEEEIPQAAEAQPAFSPVNLAQGTAPASPAAASAPSLDGEELDNLPDIGDFGGGASESHDEVIEDSEFAEEGANRPRRQTELSDGKVADVKDAPIMAEAIRTILSSED